MSILSRNIAANFIAKGWGTASLLLATPFYIRSLGLEGFGMIGIFNSLLIFFSVFDFGFGTTLNRHLAQTAYHTNRDHHSKSLLLTFEMIYLLAGLLLVLAAFSSTAWIATSWLKFKHLPANEMHSALLLMFLSIITAWPTFLYSNGLRGLQNQVLENSLLIGSMTLRHAGGVLALIFGPRTIITYFGWQLLTNAIYMVTLRILLWKKLPQSNEKPRLSIALLKTHKKFSSGVLGFSILAFIISQYDKITLSKMLPLSIFACYSFAYTLALGVLSFICVPIQNAFFPIFSKYSKQENPRALIESYQQASQMMFSLLIPLSLSIYLFCPLILLHIIPDPAAAKLTSQILQVLIIGACLNGMGHLSCTLLFAAGRTRILILNHTFIIITLVPASIFLSHHYGWMAMAYSWIVINGFYIFITTPWIHYVLFRKEHQIRFLYSFLSPTVISFSILLPLSWLIPESPVLKLGYAVIVSFFTTIITFISSSTNRQILKKKTAPP